MRFFNAIFLILVIPRTTPFSISSINIKKNINSRLNINMYYEKSKGFDECITILPYTQTAIIINNWLNATIISRAKKIQNLIDTSGLNTEELLENELSKSLYEFKVFASLNKQNINTVYFSWIPHSHKNNRQVIYLLAGKINNNTLDIYRIAHNPYAIDQLLVKSEDMLLDLYNYHKNNKVINEITFNELHKFDKRYYLSWNFKID
tara:strand:- start:10747 stop:11364 length:618 start_codon:yes stop_codon:yes gene_type:complete